MDSISVTILRYRSTLGQIDVLEAEKDVFKNSLEICKTRNTFLVSSLDTEREKLSTTKEIHKSELKKKDAEIVFLKGKNSFGKRLTDYLIALLVGFGVGVAVF